MQIQSEHIDSQRWPAISLGCAASADPNGEIVDVGAEHRNYHFGF